MAKEKPKQARQQQKPITTRSLTPISTGNGLAHVNPVGEFCVLKNYSEREFATLLHIDPSFMATDRQNYKDQDYVRSMCNIYTAISQNTMEPINKMQRFKLADLEQAFIKLSREHPQSYKQICNVYGIDPKNKRSKKRSGYNARIHLLHLCSWGYVELFQPNVLATIDKVAKKMYSSTEMSNLEKSKYAHLFFLFIYGGNSMPYDLGRFIQLTAKHQLCSKEPLTKKVREALFEQATSEMIVEEQGSLYEAIMLDNAYNILFQEFDDESVNIDMIKHFLNEILAEPERLRIKEFLDLLTEDEKKAFSSKGLSPIDYNVDIRKFNEAVFPVGDWHTDIRLFLCNNEAKFNRSVKAACNKFARNHFEFGANVKPYKKPPVFRHGLSGEAFSCIGYLYASSPLTIRISDVNELHMMRIYCESL